MFADRCDAGRQLADRLRSYGDQHAVVLALPRGGVPVALEIALAISAPLDLIFAAKIGAPEQPELAVGAVADGPNAQRVLNDEIIAAFKISEHYLDVETDRQLAKIARRRRLYLGDREPTNLADRIVIVVDDGIATGATTRAALRAVKQSGPSRVILAVPVASPQALAALKSEADVIICLEPLADMAAISMAYRDFHQLSDAEVIALLKQASAGRAQSDAG
ncbi:MAG: phosphoribosyltransferase [Alphaproteobacteria bacterium]